MPGSSGLIGWMGWTRALRDRIRFASVGGPARVSEQLRAQYLALGSVQSSDIDTAFVACDGDVWKEMPEFGPTLGVQATRSVMVCRGNLTGGGRDRVGRARGRGHRPDAWRSDLRFSVIRASGEGGMPRFKDAPLTGGFDVRPAPKDATAPYKFFELADVGLSVVDDEEGLVVAEVKPGTPFGSQAA